YRARQARRREHQELRHRRRARPAHRHGRRRQPADHPGRRRHSRGRSPRRGQHQTARGDAQEAWAGEVSVSGRLLGVDYGRVRVGLALSDPERRLASPLATYERRDETQDARYFKELVAEHEIAALVVGLPVHLDGNEGRAAAEARAFGTWLAKVTGLPCIFYDERFT